MALFARREAEERSAQTSLEIEDEGNSTAALEAQVSMCARWIEQ